MLPIKKRGQNNTPMLGNAKGIGRLPITIENLSQNIQNAIVSDGTLQNVDTIFPEVGSSLYNFENNILNRESDEAILRQWEGILAIIALSKLFALNLTFEVVNYNINVKTSVAHKAHIEALIKKGCFQEKSDGTYDFHQILIDDKPIAMFYQETIVAPYRFVDKETKKSLRNIPWYDDKTGNWLKVEEKISENEARYLAKWLDNIVNFPVVSVVTDQNVKDKINSFKARLLRVDTLTMLDFPKTDKLNVQAIKWGRVDSSIIEDIPDFAVDISKTPIFSEKIAFAHAEQLTLSPDGSNNINLTIPGNAGRHYTALLPISKEFADLINSEDELNVLSASIVYPIVNNKMEISIVIKNGNLDLVRTKEYNEGEILFIEQFPYFTVWPYVAVSNWKDYYVTMASMDDLTFPDGESYADLFTSLKCSSIDNIIIKSNVDDLIKTVGDINTLDKFKMVHYDYCPQTLSLTFQDGPNQYPIGALLIKPNNTPIAVAGKAKVAIDFGTSNTICAINVGNGTTYKILNGDYVKPIVRFRNSNNVEINGEKIKEFHSYYWLSNTETFNEKFPTVFQLYDTNADGIMEQGRILPATLTSMLHFSNSSENGNLEDVKVYSNIKTPSAIGGGVLAQVSLLFMKNLFLLTALDAKVRRLDDIEYVMSYPDEGYLKNLKEFWENAIAELDNKEIFSNPVSLKCLTEAKAATLYHTHAVATLGQPDAKVGFAIVDIGGGTTDVSLTREAKNVLKYHALYSVRYAGNQIMGNTIYNMVRKYSSAVPVLDIWNSPEGGASNLETIIVNNLAKDLPKMVAGGQVVDNLDATPVIDNQGNIGIDEAKLNKSLLAVFNTLTENRKFNLSTKNGWKNSIVFDVKKDIFGYGKTLIGIKAVGVFYMLAKSIKEYNAVDLNEIGSFKIYMLGGAANAINLLGYDSIDMLQKTIAKVLGDETIAKRFEIVNKPTTKREIVDGLLKYDDTTVVPVADNENSEVVKIPEIAGTELKQIVLDYIKDYIEPFYEEESKYLVNAVETVAGQLDKMWQVVSYYIGTSNLSLDIIKAVFAVRMIEFILIRNDQIGGNGFNLKN